MLLPPGGLFGRSLDLGLASCQVDQPLQPTNPSGAGASCRIRDFVHREQPGHSGSSPRAVHRRRSREGSRELARYVGEWKIQEEPAVIVHPSAAPRPKSCPVLVSVRTLEHNESTNHQARPVAHRLVLELPPRCRGTDEARRRREIVSKC